MRVALICVLIEAAGLALIWLASGRVLAAAGSALGGFGYSLVYHGLGVEAVRRAPPQSRGLAMGAYTVFLDVALGFGSPALGLIASLAGLGSVFLASTLVVLGTAIIAVRLLNPPGSAARQRGEQRPQKIGAGLGTKDDSLNTEGTSPQAPA